MARRQNRTSVILGVCTPRRRMSAGRTGTRSQSGAIGAGRETPGCPVESLSHCEQVIDIELLPRVAVEALCAVRCHNHPCVGDPGALICCRHRLMVDPVEQFRPPLARRQLPCLALQMTDGLAQPCAIELDVAPLTGQLVDGFAHATVQASGGLLNSAERLEQHVVDRLGHEITTLGSPRKPVRCMSESAHGCGCIVRSSTTSMATHVRLLGTSKAPAWAGMLPVGGTEFCQPADTTLVGEPTLARR